MATVKKNHFKRKRSQQHVFVGRNDGGVIPGTPGKVKIARFGNITKASQYIQGIAKHDPKGVDEGEYYIDAPESKSVINRH